MADTSQSFGARLLGGLADAAGGGIIGLAGNILGGITDSIFGSGDDSRDLMNHQYDLQRKLMQYQSELNSPAKIAGEYLKAGMNPNVVMGQGSGSSGGQSAGGSISIPESGYETLSPTIGLLHADTLQKLAGAYKNTREGSVVRSVAEASIFKDHAEGLSAKARANLDNIEADFKKAYGDKLYQGEIAKKAAEVAELYQKANLAIAEQDYTEAKTVVEHLEQVIKNEIAKQEDYKSQMLAQRLNSYPQMLRLEIRGMEEQNRKTHAEGTEAYASASEHNAGAREKTASAEFKEFDNSMRNQFKEDIFNNYALKLRKEGKLSQADYLEALRRASEVENFNNFRDKNAVVRAVDDLLTWFASKVNIAVSGSVSKDVK